MYKIVISVLFLFTPMVCLAGSGGGKVENILILDAGGNGQGTLIFRTQYNTNKAACGSGTLVNDWAASLENASGQAMLAVLMLARAQNKTVSVHGADDCLAWGDRERPQFIFLND